MLATILFFLEETFLVFLFSMEFSINPVVVSHIKERWRRMRRMFLWLKIDESLQFAIEALILGTFYCISYVHTFLS